MFPAKMRKKGTGVALAKSSSMTKSVSFSISLRESKCNLIYLVCVPFTWGLMAFL